MASTMTGKRIGAIPSSASTTTGKSMTSPTAAKARHEQLRQLWNDGKAVSEIRQIMSMTSDRAVTAMVSYLRLTPRRGLSRPGDPDLEHRVRILRDRNPPPTIDYIAQQVGMSVSWVRRVLRDQPALQQPATTMRGNNKPHIVYEHHPWPALPENGCRFAETMEWKPGDANPWCSKPTRRGRAYCDEHHERCRPMLQSGSQVREEPDAQIAPVDLSPPTNAYPAHLGPAE